MEKYFLGITRFSAYIPNSKAWQLSKNNDEENYQKILFDDARLQDRFDILFGKAIPIYEIFYKKYNYLHVLFYSERMPDKWKSKLKNESRRYPFIVLINAEEECDFDLENHLVLINSYFGNPSGPLSVFRVDDDDLLSCDFLDSLAKYTEPSFKGMCISYGYGAVGVWEHGEYTCIRDVRRHSLALGMTFVGELGEGGLEVPSWRQNHTAVMKKLPLVIDSRERMYLWTHHCGQDTKSSEGKNVYEDIFLNYDVCSSYDEIKRKFPSLCSDVSKLKRSRQLVFATSNERISDNKFVEACLEPGYYEVEYLISKVGCERNSRAAILYFARSNIANNGLFESPKNSIGFYHYLSSECDLGPRVIKFRLKEKVESGFFIGKWLEKNFIDFCYIRMYKIW